MLEQQQNRRDDYLILFRVNRLAAPLTESLQQSEWVERQWAAAARMSGTLRCRKLRSLASWYTSPTALTQTDNWDYLLRCFLRSR